MERKSRTRRLIELGGLVSKAGLEDLDSNTLLGGLIHLKQLATDSKMKEEFAHQGGQAFAKENQKKSPVIVKFDEKPDEKIRTKIREIGIKWNAIRQEWHGYVDLVVLKNLLKNEDADVVEIKMESAA